MGKVERHICLFEDEYRLDLYPFTLLQPVYDLRIGLLTFRARWEKALNTPVSGIPVTYLNPGAIDQFPFSSPEICWVNGRALPHPEFIRLLKDLPLNTYVTNLQGEVLCAVCERKVSPTLTEEGINLQDWERMGLVAAKEQMDFPLVRKLPDLISSLATHFTFDFQLLTQEGTSHPIRDAYTRVYGKENVWIGEGAIVKSAVIDATDGPVYIGPGARVEPQTYIASQVGIGRRSYVAPGAQLRPLTIAGEYVALGGEIKRSMLMDYTNKGHYGYLGDSIIGRACNLGAGTTVSNLKNTLSTVRQWNYRAETFLDTGVLKCGLMMGDFCKSGIGTLFNTGTVVGVSSHVWGPMYLPKFIPSFSWGNSQELTRYKVEKALQTAAKTLALKQVEIPKHTQQLFYKIAELTEKYHLTISQ